MSALNLLAGPPRAAGAESFDHHRRRLGSRPAGSLDLVETLERSGLLGRGGGSFPVGTKWRSVAERAGGSAVVIANGAESDPMSSKDQTLMAYRPHLVLDGVLLAAESVGASQVVLYVGEHHHQALAAMGHALRERPAAERARLVLLAAPSGYVAGEATAAVHFVNERVATPTATPPRPSEAGVHRRPTLVQNVESLAHAALVARRGDAWFRSIGRSGAGGSVLLTMGGAVGTPGVVEVGAGTTLGEALELAGGVRGPLRAVLLGGHFGGFVDAGQALGLRLDPGRLKATGRSLGCGSVHALGGGQNPLQLTAAIMRQLAAESAAQCGPCFFGLRSLADATTRIASGKAEPEDWSRLHRWLDMVEGRGACRHPDGAVGLLRSALRVFAPEFATPARLGDKEAA